MYDILSDTSKGKSILGVSPKRDIEFPKKNVDKTSNFLYFYIFAGIIIGVIIIYFLLHIIKLKLQK